MTRSDFSVGRFAKRVGDELGVDCGYFVKGGMWLTLPIIVNNLLGVLRSVVFARLLSQETYGQFGFINDTLSTFSFLMLPGLGNALVESVARGNHASLKDAAVARMRWGVLLSLVVGGVASYYWWKGEANVATALFVGGLIQPWASAFSLVRGYFSGLKRFDRVSLLTIAQSVLNTLVLLLLVWFGKGLIWLVVANYGANLAFYLIVYLATIQNLESDRRDLDVVAYGRSLTWARLIMSVSTSLDGVILGLTGGFVDVAVFRVASILPKSAKNLIQMLRPLALPKIAEKPAKKIYTPSVWRKLAILLVGNFLFVALAMIAMQILIPLIYGDVYHSSVRFAQLLMLSLAFGWPNAFFVAALQARKKIGAIARANLIYGGLLIFSLVVFVPVWGIGGVVLSRILSRWGSAFYRWFEVTKL